MTDDETPSWERLYRLSKMSEIEQGAQTEIWAGELVDRLGMDALPQPFRNAHRNLIAAILLSLLDEGTSVRRPGEGGHADRRNGTERWSSDVSRAVVDRSREVSAPVVRAWAKRQGISLSERGRLPMWVIHRYHIEHDTDESEAPYNQHDPKATYNQHDPKATSDHQLILQDSAIADELAAADDGSTSSDANNQIDEFLKILHGDSNS